MKRTLLAGAVACLAAVSVAATATVGGGQAQGGPGWAALEPSPLQRTEVAAALLDGTIYVMGGFVPEGGDTGRMVAYDVAADDWSEVAPHPIAVNHAGLVAAQGRIYAHGGQRGPGGGPLSARLTRYNPATDRWKRVSDSPTARAAMAFLGRGDRLYAIGGRTAASGRSRALEIYDISQDRWHRGPDLEVGRNHLAGAASGDEILAIGGRPGPIIGNRRTVERWRIGSGAWEPAQPLGTARSGAVAIALASGDVVAFGGEELGGGGNAIEQVERLDAETGEWSYLPDMATPRHGLGGATDGSRLYAIEGGPSPGLHYSSANEYLDPAP